MLQCAVPSGEGESVLGRGHKHVSKGATVQGGHKSSSHTFWRCGIGVIENPTESVSGADSACSLVELLSTHVCNSSDVA